MEDLSELLESPIEPEMIATLRQKMTDKTVRAFLPLLAPTGACHSKILHSHKQVYVQKRNEIVLADTAQGFLDGRWAWNVELV